jgi:hypothetical protein
VAYKRNFFEENTSFKRHEARQSAPWCAWRDARAMAADAPFFSRRGARPCASARVAPWCDCADEKKRGWSEQRDRQKKAAILRLFLAGSPKYVV